MFKFFLGITIIAWLYIISMIAAAAFFEFVEEERWIAWLFVAGAIFMAIIAYCPPDKRRSM